MEGIFGACTQELSSAMKKALGVEYGILVTGTVEGLPAYKAGIRIGDIILEIEDKKIETKKMFDEFVRKNPGKEVALTLLRRNEKWKFKVKLGEDEKKKSPTKRGIGLKGTWGGGVGGVFLYVQPDVEELNKEVEKVISKRLDKNMWLKGWGIWGSIYRNIIIGGAWGSGSKIKSGNKRETEFTLEYGGFLGEYIFSFGKLRFFIGSILGKGKVGLTIWRSTKASWREIWDNFQTDSLSSEYYEIKLESDFFHYHPYIGIQYPITPWCYLNLKYGYFGTTLGEWREMGTQITDTPLVNLSGNCISLGVILGYFTK
jgi:hypothetical protein